MEQEIDGDGERQMERGCRITTSSEGHFPLTMVLTWVEEIVLESHNQWG